jgi:hypothetical protein
MFGLFKKKPSLKEAIAQSNFIDATAREIPKKLGLTHSPRVQSTVDEYSHLTFNQKALLLSKSLKKGIKKSK